MRASFNMLNIVMLRRVRYLKFLLQSLGKTSTKHDIKCGVSKLNVTSTVSLSIQNSVWR